MAEKFFTAHFSGGPELQKALEALATQAAKKLLRKSAVEAATLWKQEISARAPRLAAVKLASNAEHVRIPGYLARHIMLKAKVNADLEAQVLVGPSKGAFYALFIEFGWAVRKSTFAGVRYKRFMRRSAEVKGRVAARRFIEQAFDAKARAVLDQFISSAKRILSEEAAKHV